MISFQRVLTSYYQQPNCPHPRVLKDGPIPSVCRRPEPRLPQHRPLQRRVVPALRPLVAVRPSHPFLSPLPTRTLSTAGYPAANPRHGALLLQTTQPHRLRDAPGSAETVADATYVDHGKTVFAERCARCHSARSCSRSRTRSDGCAAKTT